MLDDLAGIYSTVDSSS